MAIDALNEARVIIIKQKLYNIFLKPIDALNEVRIIIMKTLVITTNS